MEGLDRLRLSSVVCALFIRSGPRKRYFADHPSHFSDGLLVQQCGLMAPYIFRLHQYWLEIGRIIPIVLTANDGFKL
ncbi:MAG: hypothetical protein KTR25_10330 [Myxococcales bacterium]|nr:hypothetical protein [Myxococcales bacterium]